MLEKYNRLPHEWDTSHPPFLLPKELRDIEHKELLEAKMYQEAENKTNEEVKPDTTSASRPAKYVNQIPDNPNQPLKERPEDHIPKIDIDKRDEHGNLKPITTMDELAVLMGTDPEVLQQTKNADT